MLTVSPVTATLGAEVEGVDLSEDLDDPVISEIRRALVDHKVLLFRSQERLAPKTQIAFARRFGELETNPFRSGVDGFPEVNVLRGEGVLRGRDTWHSDTSFKPRPSMAAVLRAVEIPPVGRDTVWADMEAVYADLSGDLKELLAGKRAVHDSAPQFTNEEGHTERICSEHPVVRTHPESGRKSIYVNKVNTTKIVGMPERESANLLAFLFEQVHMPEYQVRLRWAPGTVAMWDNRSTNHYLVVDVEGLRIMHRVSIMGEVPV